MPLVGFEVGERREAGGQEQMGSDLGTTAGPTTCECSGPRSKHSVKAGYQLKTSTPGRQRQWLLKVVTKVRTPTGVCHKQMLTC